MADVDEPIYMTIDEAAWYADITPERFRIWIYTDRLPAVEKSEGRSKFYLIEAHALADFLFMPRHLRDQRLKWASYKKGDDVMLERRELLQVQLDNKCAWSGKESESRPPGLLSERWPPAKARKRHKPAPTPPVES